MKVPLSRQERHRKAVEDPWRRRAAGVIVAVMIIAGCDTGGEAPATDPMAQRVLTLRIADFHDAFDALSTVPHDAERIDVVSEAPPAPGFRAQAHLRFVDDRYETIDRTSEGELPRCRSCEILRRSSDADPESVGRLFVDPEAPFLTERGSSAFDYAAGPDTLVDGRLLESIIVTARQDEPRAGRYRAARLFIDPLDERLVGLDLETERSTFFVQEVGRLAGFVTRLGEESFPREVTIRQDVRVLFGDRRSIRTQIRYTPSL